jgi:CRISPR type I-E/ECOLI-associated protein CasA/Cse1
MFNLVNDPWIPVLCKESSKLVSLKEVFEDLSGISFVEGSSIEKISLIRLLLCITQAALKGPKTEKAWETCKEDIVSSSLKYLNKWKSKFDLYGKNAFLQMPWLPSLKNKTIDELKLCCPSGNNHALFDHRAFKETNVLPDPDLALALLITQGFGVGGLIQIPEFKWLGKKVPKLTSANATSINNILLTIIVGENLLDTLYHNIIPIEWLTGVKTMIFGSPVWEYDPFEINGPEYKEIQSSYLSNLVPLTRGFILYPNDTSITMTQGISSLDYPAYREPMASLKTNKISAKPKKETGKKKDPKKAYLSCRLHRAGWRELESILRTSNGADHKEVWAFRHFINQIDAHPEIIIMVGGFASFQSKKEGVLEWVFTLPAGFLNDSSMLKYKKFVETTETCYKQLCSALWFCIKSERKRDVPGDKDNTLAMMRNIASTEYWPKMEVLAMKTLETITKDKDWKTEILKITRDIFNRSCPDISMNSKVKGLQHLYSIKEEKE